MSSHSSNLKNLFKFREPIKDLSKVSILKTKHLEIILGGRLDRHVLVLVSYLEDKTDVAKVTSFFKAKQHLFVFSPECLDTTSVDKVNA
jgi:hypothetical protein